MIMGYCEKNIKSGREINNLTERVLIRIRNWNEYENLVI